MTSNTEQLLKTITTHGLAVVMSVVLLGYVLWKDYSQGERHVNALNNNTQVIKGLGETLETQTATLEQQTAVMRSLRDRIQLKQNELAANRR